MDELCLSMIIHKAQDTKKPGVETAGPLGIKSG
jgi:hypothetical protein